MNDGEIPEQNVDLFKDMDEKLKGIEQDTTVEALAVMQNYPASAVQQLADDSNTPPAIKAAADQRLQEIREEGVDQAHKDIEGAAIMENDPNSQNHLRLKKGIFIAPINKHC